MEGCIFYIRTEVLEQILENSVGIVSHNYKFQGVLEIFTFVWGLEINIFKHLGLEVMIFQFFGAEIIIFQFLGMKLYFSVLWAGNSNLFSKNF